MFPLLLLAACVPIIRETPPDPELMTEVPFPIDEVDLVGFVDPMIGTAGPGNVVPGALVPHGMVRASPDTRSGPNSIDAYDWGDALLEGFTHTHLEGPGGSANGYSQVLVLPQTGPIVIDPDARDTPLDHDAETARPGHYTLTLEDGTVAELTATGHAAVHRYRFPAGEARLLLDLGHSNGRSTDGELLFDGDVIRGHGEYNVHPIAALLTQDDGRTAYTRIFVHGELSVVPTTGGTWRGRDPAPQLGSTEVSGAWIGGWVGWTFDAPTTVELRMGLSLIDEDQAEANLRAEVGASSFDEVAAEAASAWNTALNRVQADVTGALATTFYTALYRTMMQPADYTEAGGVFAVGRSGEHVVRQAVDHRYFTDDWCLWDTFRTSHPLATLIEPELRDDIISSLLVDYEEGGWLPKCTWNATGYSRVMTGNHAVPVIADALVKGLDGFDTMLAWEAIDRAGTEEIDPLPDGLCGYVNQGTPPDYLTLGYVPSECDPTQSASMTMEHAYDDWAAARFAEAVGRPDDAERYDLRSDNWKRHWNPAVGFVQGVDRAGNWVEPFDPADGSDANDFVEATAWIFSFHVFHDVPGMVELFGGTDAFVARLDRFFDEGHYDPSNQPSFHIPFLYAAAGRPAGTQRRVREVLDGHYHAGEDGLPGNDDAGSTSAWAVLSMLGLYPLSPGDGVYTLTAPRLEATVHLHPGAYDGGAFEVRVIGDPETQRYVAGVSWNGTSLTRARIEHAALASGGVLVFTLADEPTTWGEE